jgi:cell wall-associated NlpC family hydrolase
MKSYTQLFIFTVVLPLFFLAVPCFFYVYVLGADGSATGCFILNQNSTSDNSSVPAGCSGGGNQTVVALARKYINNPQYTYVLGAPSRDWAADKNPTNFDCSGFVGWAWYWGTNGKVSLPGTTSDAWDNAASYKLQKFMPSQISQIQPGDLVYFSGADSPKPGHVVMYEGPGVAPATCGANDCVMEFYETPLPGKADSLAQHMKEDHMYGFLRPMIK